MINLQSLESLGLNFKSDSNYKSPWLDGRKIESGMNVKQLLKTDFNPELVENIKWDVNVT